LKLAIDAEASQRSGSLSANLGRGDAAFVLNGGKGSPTV
jgi:hypothetical protein